MRNADKIEASTPNSELDTLDYQFHYQNLDVSPHDYPLPYNKLLHTYSL